MAVCKLYGYVVDASGEDLAGVTVQFIPKVTPSIRSSTGKAIAPRAIEAVTDDTGYFEADLFVDMDLILIIKAVGLKEPIRVPNETSKNVFELVNIYVSGDPTPIDTGEDDW